MKSVEKNLYCRNGYYYFRGRLPQFYASLVNRKELVIALGTRDYSQARLYSTQIGLNVHQILAGGNAPDFTQLLSKAREGTGVQPIRKPEYMTDQAYKILKQSNAKFLTFSTIPD